jgi:hypothetical protein
MGLRDVHRAQLNFTSIHFNNIPIYAKMAHKFSSSVDYSQLLTYHTNRWAVCFGVLLVLFQCHVQQIAGIAVCTSDLPVSELRPEQRILN